MNKLQHKNPPYYVDDLSFSDDSPNASIMDYVMVVTMFEDLYDEKPSFHVFARSPHCFLKSYAVMYYVIYCRSMSYATRCLSKPNAIRCLSKPNAIRCLSKPNAIRC